MMLNRERRLRLLQKSNESVKDVGLHILFALLESEKDNYKFQILLENIETLKIAICSEID